MNRVKVQHRQSLFDLVLQECGSVEAYFEAIKLNGFTSMTPILEPGLELIMPRTVNLHVRNALQKRKPATVQEVIQRAGAQYNPEQYNPEQYM